MLTHIKNYENGRILNWLATPNEHEIPVVKSDAASDSKKKAEPGDYRRRPATILDDPLKQKKQPKEEAATPNLGRNSKIL
ncbi:hypothetical protein J6590_097676 [Homalodisca vitripennis]|nr:hypothetical protein J6590_097676 [Homalodisca vitripennis]